MKSLLSLVLCILLLAGCVAGRLPFSAENRSPTSPKGQGVGLSPPEESGTNSRREIPRPAPEVESIQASFNGTSALDGF